MSTVFACYPLSTVHRDFCKLGTWLLYARARINARVQEQERQVTAVSHLLACAHLLVLGFVCPK